MEHNQEIETITYAIVHQSIIDYLDARDEPDTFHAVLDRIFPVERRIRSIIGGLETSLGTRLWEQLAVAFATRAGFEVLNPKSFTMPQDLPVSVFALKSEWDTLRKSRGSTAKIADFAITAKDVMRNSNYKPGSIGRPTKGIGLDIWLRRDGMEYAFDIKTVQVNANMGNSMNSQLMDWTVWRAATAPDVPFHARIAFPYSATAPYTVASFWQGWGGRVAPLQRVDTLVQEEFWSFVSGAADAWPAMVKAFDRIAGEDLPSRYRKLFGE